MSRIWITGIRGFVGSALRKVLESQSHEILDTGSSNTLDLCHWDAVKSLPKQDIIIHLASKSFVPASFLDPRGFYNNNILSTLNVLEKAKMDGSRVIFLSTYVYGKPVYLPIDENHVKSPLNPYTQSKFIGEGLCEAYFRDFGVPVTIFRPFNIYGPGQPSTFFIPTIINQLKNPEIQLNDSRPKRDFLFIEDVVEAIVRSVTYKSSVFNVYNLGTGVSTSVEDTVNMIVSLSQSKAIVKFSQQVRQGEILDTVADISKIATELNWKPRVELDQGLRLTIDYFN